MTTLAQAQAHLEAIEEALAQSVLTVTFADGRAVTYSSFDELIKRWHFWAKRAGVAAGRQRLLAEFKKGLTK